MRTQALFDRSCVSLASPGAVPVQRGRSRIATFGRLFEGTDEISLGQTRFSQCRIHHLHHTHHHQTRVSRQGPFNVAELLAPGNKTVSFCQGRST